MASYTAADLSAKVGALLNDTTYYTQAVLLPYLNIAQDELADFLRNSGVGQTKFWTTITNMPAATTALYQASTPALPLTLVEPIQIYERATGAAEQDFVMMIGPATIPNINAGTSLVYWDWIMDVTNGPTIQFNPSGGATSARDLRIYYYGEVTPLGTGAESMFLGGETAIIYKTAALVAASRGNLNGAQAFQEMYDRASHTYVSEMIKENQAVPGRRQPWLGGGRYLISRY